MAAWRDLLQRVAKQVRGERLHCRGRSKWRNHEVSTIGVVRKQSSKPETLEWRTVKERSSNKCHEKKASHTLTGSSTVFLLLDLSVKVNDGWVRVDVTEILIYTCNACLWKIFTATSWPLQKPWWTRPNEPFPIKYPMVGTVKKSVGLMVARKRRALESVLAKLAYSLSE